MTNWVDVRAPVIDAATKCRIISRLGIGLDNIDVWRATERGIPVTNVPDYCLTEVAEHTLALLLGARAQAAHLSGRRPRGPLRSGGRLPLRRIEGQTLGIVGLGDIGRRVAEKAAAFGLEARSPRAARIVTRRRMSAACRSTNCWRRATSSRCTCRSPSTRGR